MKVGVVEGWRDSAYGMGNGEMEVNGIF